MRVAVAEVGEREQGLSAWAKAPPPRTELAAVLAERRTVSAGGAGHVDAGRVVQHTKPLVETYFLGGSPSIRDFTCLSAQLTCSGARSERAQFIQIQLGTSGRIGRKISRVARARVFGEWLWRSEPKRQSIRFDGGEGTDVLTVRVQRVQQASWEVGGVGAAGDGEGEVRPGDGPDDVGVPWVGGTGGDHPGG